MNMPTRVKNAPGIVIVAMGLVLGMTGASASVSAQDATPEGPLVATPGATPAATPLASAEQFAAGDILTTTVESLLLRAQPTLDAEALQALSEGTQLQVFGGPEQAEGYTWYEVEVLGTDESVTGWAATSAAFVDQAVGAGDEEFAFESNLTTATENLRLRAQPTVDAETLQTLAQGTELQVISGPEQAEGYTWYEVDVLGTDETVTGWVATSADFVDAVEGAS